MTKEQILDMCKMRIDGHALQEIADKYGCTIECVRQLTPKRGYKRDKSVYPAINRWMEERNITMAYLSEMCGLSKGTISNTLNGRNSPTKYVIDKILLVTGLKYEDAFRKEQ